MNVKRIGRAVGKLPLVGPLLQRVPGLIGRLRELGPFPGSERYWESRYRTGGDSGPGSYAEVAEFKARVVNGIVREHRVRSVIEFGCGDGNQLSLAEYPRYIGLDVSPAAVSRCIDRFRNDPAKSFFRYDPHCFRDPAGVFQADLSVSLEVVFHLVEDDIYKKYLDDVFGSSRNLVVVFSSNVDGPVRYHERDREFTRDVKEWHREFALIETIPGPRPASKSDFYVFQRTERSYRHDP